MIDRASLFLVIERFFFLGEYPLIEYNFFIFIGIFSKDSLLE